MAAMHRVSALNEGGVVGRERVLCVDLDGTLLSTDLLWESFLSAVGRHLWILLVVPFWLLRGRPRHGFSPSHYLSVSVSRS
jgi:hypothetical protein